jgi:alkyl sulfatase BDS1-like metallo-beta-lactamase superfamily hydrolase
MTSANDLSADALMFALRTSLDPEAAEGLRAVYGIRLGADRFRAAVDAGRLELTRGDAQDADAVLDTDARTLRDLVFTGRSLTEAVREGAVRLDGDERAVARFVTLFPRPTPAV